MAFVGLAVVEELLDDLLLDDDVWHEPLLPDLDPPLLPDLLHRFSIASHCASNLAFSLSELLWEEVLVDTLLLLEEVLVDTLLLLLDDLEGT